MRTRRRRCCLFVEIKRVLGRVFILDLLGSLAALLSRVLPRPPTPNSSWTPDLTLRNRHCGVADSMSGGEGCCRLDLSRVDPLVMLNNVIRTM